MVKHYPYVGPHQLQLLLQRSSDRRPIEHPSDIFAWLKHTKQRLLPDHTVIVTFIIDRNEQLWIADRHSEHVVCASGQAVLAAGEMTFSVQGEHLRVVAVSNQSTGYCPEPDSWHTVASVLEQLGIEHPGDFTSAFVFRRCNACGNTNIVKEQWFVCAVCEQPLSRAWNYA